MEQPPLVGVLAPAAAPVPPPPLLPLHYQLPVVSPPLVLHPPPPLLLRPPLCHAVVNPPVTATVLGSPRVTKSPNAVKAGATPPAAKVPPPAKEAAESAAVAPGSACQQAEDKCEAAVQRETGSKIEANGSVPGEVRCEKPSGDKQEQEEEVAVPGDVSSTKMKTTKHVMILDEARKVCVELPLDKDGTLSPGLLRRHFPGVCGLTYRAPDCPHRQWVALEGGRLRAPRGGWAHSAYYCVFSEQSGGRWLHTFCHCSLSKSRRAKSPRKSPSGKNSPARSRANGLSSKKARSEEPDVYVVEDTSEGRRCSPLVVCSLPQWVTEERLREHFTQFGRLLNCAVQKDLVGGRYGVVEFRDLPAQEAALAEVFHRFGDTWCSVRLRC